MDLADIKRQALAAREFTQQVGTVRFILVAPTDHEVALATATHTGAGDMRARRLSTAATLRTQRALTELALTGWQGLVVRDLFPDQPDHKHGADEVPFEPDAVPLLLDQRPDIAEALWRPLVERLSERSKKREAAAKN